MALRPHMRLLCAAGFAAAAGTLVLAPAAAQFFDERFPFRQAPPGSIFGPPGFPQMGPPVAAPPRPVDYSRAPPPKKYEKNEGADLSTVVVLGDSMADWLGYGLEQAFADSPELTVARRPRHFSGLIARHDIRNRNTDWPSVAAEILAKENVSFVVMMVGLGDREAIRDVRPPPAKPGQKPAPGAAAKPGEKPAEKPAEKTAEKPVADKPAAPGATEAAPGLRPSVAGSGTDPEKGARIGETEPVKSAEETAADDAAIVTPEPVRNAQGAFEFKTEKWVELYTKRIDETIAALKSKNVPVFWVGLPPVRGTRSMSELTFLNDLYRSRAEKAGIIYVDVWDGFVDEGNRFTMQGPDTEGQMRRLRANDGVHFTQAGARKLAHYVEKEIHRAMTPSGPVAIPLPVDPAASQPAPGAAPGAAVARPLAGPVIPLNAAAEAIETEELLGASGARQSISDAVAARVLVRGEPLPVPQGRADDFAWPRRAPAAPGADPVVATTTFPMTPMLAERPRPPAPSVAAAAAARTQQQQVQARAPRPPGAPQLAQQQMRDPFRRGPMQPPPPFFFFFSR